MLALLLMHIAAHFGCFLAVKLLTCALLNTRYCLLGPREAAYSLFISRFESAPLPVLKQENICKLNRREIVGPELRDGRALAQH